MLITIKEKEYNVRFGMKFLREMDKNCTIEREKLKFGASMETKVPMLFAKDAITLSEVLYAGTNTSTPRPKPAEIDDFIDDHEDIEGLFDEVIEELKNSNATKLKMTALEKEMRMSENL